MRIIVLFCDIDDLSIFVGRFSYKCFAQFAGKIVSTDRFYNEMERFSVYVYRRAKGSYIEKWMKAKVL